MATLNRRIQMIEDDLEKSEERLRLTTAKLEEAHQAADESERVRKMLENKTNMEDDRIAYLESQLAQARTIAEESDKKYEEVSEKGRFAQIPLGFQSHGWSSVLPYIAHLLSRVSGGFQRIAFWRLFDRQLGNTEDCTVQFVHHLLLLPLSLLMFVRQQQRRRQI